MTREQANANLILDIRDAYNSYISAPSEELYCNMEALIFYALGKDLAVPCVGRFKDHVGDLELAVSVNKLNGRKYYVILTDEDYLLDGEILASIDLQELVGMILEDDEISGLVINPQMGKGCTIPENLFYHALMAGIRYARQMDAEN